MPSIRAGRKQRDRCVYLLSFPAFCRHRSRPIPMRFVLPLAVGALTILNGTVAAETTPLAAPLSEEKEITITCELTKTEPHQNIVVFDSAKDSEKLSGTYHYKLWLPKGYLADAQRR